MKKLLKILYKEFITEEEMKYIEEHAEVEQVENCGKSGRYFGKTWFNVLLVDGTEHSVYLK